MMDHFEDELAIRCSRCDRSLMESDLFWHVFAATNAKDLRTVCRNWLTHDEVRTVLDEAMRDPFMRQAMTMAANASLAHVAATVNETDGFDADNVSELHGILSDAIWRAHVSSNPDEFRGSLDDGLMHSSDVSRAAAWHVLRRFEELLERC